MLRLVIFILFTFCLSFIDSLRTLAAATSSIHVDNKIKVIHPSLPGDIDFYAIVLEHALSYSNGKYQTQAIGIDLPHGRDFKLLAKNKQLHVVFGGARASNEDLYQAIHFPLLKGLIGWRIPLLKTENKNLFKSVTTLEQFKKLMPGQHFNWWDTEILQSNNITVATSISYDGLFDMLVKERFDYFPRSVLEVHRELEHYSKGELVIDENVLIYYPTVSYMYVNKNNPTLAKDILFGLEASLADGSYDKIFYATYGEILDSLNIGSRQIIKLNNPLISRHTPLLRTELLLEPEDL